MKTMSAQTVIFQREQHGRWEDGIAINDGTGIYDVKVIIDINFKPVPTPIYQYELTPKGCFNFLAGS